MLESIDLRNSFLLRRSAKWSSRSCESSSHRGDEKMNVFLPWQQFWALLWKAWRWDSRTRILERWSRNAFGTSIRLQQVVQRIREARKESSLTLYSVSSIACGCPPAASFSWTISSDWYEASQRITRREAASFSALACRDVADVHQYRGGGPSTIFLCKIHSTMHGVCETGKWESAIGR